MSKKAEQMIPGKRYRGWGFINEFKEFQFIPEETGSREGSVKQVCQRNGVTVSHSKQHIIVHFKIKKSAQKLEIIKSLTYSFNQLIKIVQEYEF